jgi:hypothetical protein
MQKTKLSPAASHRVADSGFTLVEMLAIAPVALLVISGFLALMTYMTGDILATRESNVLVYDTQDALNRIEQDIRLSTGFATTTGNLLSPQGSDDGTTAFDSSSALILSQYATTAAPTDPDRQLVYLKNIPTSVANCNGTNEVNNNTLQLRIIYYIKDGSLWRRTIVPPYNTNAVPAATQVCDAPWQKNSCSPGYSSSRCNTNDSEVLANITSMSTTYVDARNSPSPVVNATAAKITITTSKQAAGRTITNRATVRAFKLNS